MASLLVFTANTDLWDTQSLEVREKVWRKKDSPMAKEVRDHLGKKHTHKFIGLSGTHPQVLRDLVNITLFLKVMKNKGRCLRTGRKLVSLQSPKK